MTVSIIIPAYNEKNYLPITLDTLSNHRFWDEIIVVDDGSIDGTSIVKLPKGVKMIVHESNFGKGNAIFTGLNNSIGNTLLLLDADLGETAFLAERLLQPIIDGTADMVIAKFPPTGKNGGFGFVKKVAKQGIQYFTGEYVFEPLSGQRCLKREVINSIRDFHVGFGFEVALTIDVIRAGYTISEVEVPFKHRELGRNWRGFYHRGKELTHILKTFWMKR